MIDKIFEMIMEEIRHGNGETTRENAFTVLAELTIRVYNALQPPKINDIKKTRLTFRRKEP